MNTAWKHAMLGLPHRQGRTSEAAQQIADAREEPTIEELDAERMAEVDRKLCADEARCFGTGPTQATPRYLPTQDHVVLTGTELDAYRVLRAAATAAHQAQQTMATTGATLRDAIQGLCAAIAPGSKS